MSRVVVVSPSREYPVNIKNLSINPRIIKLSVLIENYPKISIEGHIVINSCIIIVSIAIKKDNPKIANNKQRDKNNKIHEPILTELTITTQIHRSNAKLLGKCIYEQG